MHKSTGVIRLIIVLIKMRMDEWTDATDQLAASPRPGRSSNNTPSSYTRIIHHQDHPVGSSTRIILKDHPTTLYHSTPGSSFWIIHNLHPPGSSNNNLSSSTRIIQDQYPSKSSNRIIHHLHPTALHYPPTGSSGIFIHQYPASWAASNILQINLSSCYMNDI